VADLDDPDGGVIPCDEFPEILRGCQRVARGTKWSRNIAENFNRLSKGHERYRKNDIRICDGIYPNVT